MSRHPKHPLASSHTIQPAIVVRFGAAVATVIAAALLRFWLQPSLGDRLPFATFSIGVIIASWYGGLWPGLLALVLGSVAGIYLFTEPYGSLWLFKIEDYLSLATYLIIGLATVGFSGQLRTARFRSEYHRMMAEAEIRERDRISQALNESETRFRMMADSAPLMIWVHDPDRRCEYVSKGWCTFTGQSFDEALDAGWLEAVHPEDRQWLAPARLSAMERQQPFTFEYRLLHHSGAYRWVLDRGVARFTSGGDYLGYIGTIMDISERKAGEETLREREERFRVALANSAIVVFMQDMNLRYTWIYNLMPDLHPEAVLGKTDLEVHIPGVAQRLTEIKQQVLNTGRGTHTEVEVYLNERWLTYEMTLEPLRNDSGEVIGLTGAAHDITDRKRVERALRASEERLRIILENIPVMVVGVSADGVPLFWNRECERVTGYDASDVLGSTSLTTLLSIDSEVRGLLVGDRDETEGAHLSWVVPLTAKDGARRYIAWTNISKRYPIPGWANWAIGIDVTEQHKAQDRANRLQTVTAKLSEAVTPQEVAQLIVSPDFAAMGAHIGVIGVISDDRTITLTSSKHELPEEINSQFRSLSVDAPTPLSDCIRTRQPIWLESASAYRECYPELAAATYPYTHTQALVCLPLIVEGHILGAVGLTFPEPRTFDSLDRGFLIALAQQCAQALDRARLYEAEAVARREAEKANELKTRFLAMISHELRTPLTSIKGFTSTMLAPDVNWDQENLNEFLQIIDSEAEKLADLVEQLLDVSTLQAGTLRIYPSPQRLTDIVQISMAQLLNLTSQHELLIDVSEGLPPVLADGQRIAQVIGNLVGNAAKYSPPYTRISISAHLQDAHVQVEVSDEGEGIPADSHTWIFEAFRQGNKQHKGAGLGLAICKGLVEAHGGTIWVADRGGPGTTIAFTLPIAREAIFDTA